MLRAYGVVRAAATQVADAVDRTVGALHDGRIEHETIFTDRMLGAIEQSMNGFEARGVRWTAKTLTYQGRGAQETQFGPDFVGVLDVKLPRYEVQKGFLAQAKLIEPGKNLDQRNWDRLVGQCHQMLTLSPDAFVFIYSRDRLRIVPAIAVVAAGVRDPAGMKAGRYSATPNLLGLYNRTVRRFFEEHFESFIGDQNISAPNIDTLEQLRERMEARSILYLRASRE